MKYTTRLSEDVRDGVWQLLDLGGVELLNLSHHVDVSLSDKVDSNTLSTETTTSTDSVDVVLLVGWQVVVDNEGNLLDIDTTGKQVSGDQDSGRTGSELLHDGVSLLLGQVRVNSRDSELVSGQLLGQLLNLSSGVTEDNGLGDRDGLVKITQTVELVLLLLNVDEELLNTLKGQLILLNQDSDWVSHELAGDLQNILWHGGGQKDNLGATWQQGEDVVDLLLETGGKHLIGLIQNEHLDSVNLEETTLNHVENTTWGTDNDLSTLSEGVNVLLHGGTTNRGVDGDVHVGTDGENDLLDLEGQLSGWGENQSLGSLEGLVNSLEGRDGEGSSLTGTGLGLGKNITLLNNWQDSTLLNGGWSLVTVTVDT